MDDSQGQQAGPPPVVLSRKERNHVAELAMLHMGWAGEAISPTFNKLDPVTERENAQRIAVLFNLREDLGWEDKAKRGGRRRWALSLTPPATLRALLRNWHRDAVDQLTHVERGLADAIVEENVEYEAEQREECAKANLSLQRTLDLLARLEREAVDLGGGDRGDQWTRTQVIGAVQRFRDDAREHPILTVAEVRAARARINATYQVGERMEDAETANRIDAEGDAERTALYERVIGAVAKGNVEDAAKVMRIALGWEGSERTDITAEPGKAAA
jgi:hypothetical protein